MKILIDAFGGDNSPSEIIAGTMLAVNERQDFTAVLVGKKQEIEKELKKYTFASGRVEIIDAQEVISCEEEPTVAIRRKPNSSICVALNELKENEEMKAFVSAGSTGAVLVGATLKVGRIQGVNRPALCTLLPTFKGDKKVLLLDCGANADCKAINLCQFAIMGSAYMESLGMTEPKVALLSNGTEDEKGNALNHEVFPRLKAMKNINFVGNMEARDILSGEYDVVVADGFSGNIALKSMEGSIKGILKGIKQSINASFKGKLGGLLLKGGFTALKDKLDYTKHGGALFIGVKKPVIKAHGSVDSEAFRNAVIQAVNYAGFNISENIAQKLALEPIEF